MFLLRAEGEAMESFLGLSLAISGSKWLVAAVPMDCRAAAVPPIIDLIVFFLAFRAETAF